MSETTWRTIVGAKQGLILLTGVTGSGKIHDHRQHSCAH